MRGAETLWRVEFGAIARIECYKRDELTTDLICFDIWFDSGDQQQVVWVHEELPGWNDLAEGLKQLPGFDPDWHGKVFKLAFVENRTVVYERKQSV
ncbi:MAG: hypothetical protein Q8R02_02105 [Hyphomonadaceae bacterium]|nr:hypothetical protein [Hyphomonadaceae bacterium]